ncbi:MAG: TolC family protein [Sandaracinaceae bacterium]|nr:TolC family protein [Sandaracinaceae bacterium]
MRWLPIAIVLASACGGASRDRAWVSARLVERVGAPIATETSTEVPDVDVTDGIDEHEAVALALWNNPTYRGELARLDAARANVEEAGRPPSPQLSAAGPIGPIAGALALLMPLEWLWQLPQRLETASRDLESVAEELVQRGLDLARDARLAHADCVLAEGRVEARRQLADVASRLLRIATIRAAAGDISVAEAAAVEGEAAMAADAVRVAEADAISAQARLQIAIGDDASPQVSAESSAPGRPPALGTLIASARESRPEARAAELALAAAAARAGWERARVISLAATVDAQWRGNDVGARVGGRIELPSWGKPGGVGRADAGVEAARARVDATRLRIATEIADAHARLVQAIDSLEAYRATILPALDRALAGATQSFELGEEGMLLVLDALSRSTTARLREIELIAQARRASADLDRAVGGHFTEATP